MGPEGAAALAILGAWLRHRRKKVARRARTRRAQPTYVYRFWNDWDQLIYVGMTNDPDRRFEQHKMGARWYDEAARVTGEWYPSRSTAASVELAAIKKENPKYNVAGRVRGAWR